MLYLKTKSPMADLQTEHLAECYHHLLTYNIACILSLAPSSGHITERLFAN